MSTRDLSALEEREFDVVVVGGGIFGICIAWDAAARGLSVALLERGDFAEAASAHSFKMVHGGIRYLQHGDLPRVRESVRERRALLRIAPHLVHPLPIVIPTYGHGLQGSAALWAAFRLYDLIAADRNLSLRDPARRISSGRLLTRAECLTLFPGLEQAGLTGAGVFEDGQMFNPPRLALSFLLSAIEAGAVAANYVGVTRLRVKGTVADGVEAVDALGGERVTCRARVVVNAAGGWAPGVLHSAGVRLRPGATFSRDACFLIKRQLHASHALALIGRTRDPDALLSRAARHLFVVPWRDYSLIGVWHTVYAGDPDAAVVTERDIQAFVDEANAACPSLALAPDEVTCYNAGLVLFGENRPGATHLSYGKRSRIVDHRAADGVNGLITCLGVRWTTARGVAERVVELVGRKLGRRLRPGRTNVTPIYGGAIDDVARFTSDALASRPPGIAPEVMRDLVRNHGSAYGRVLAHGGPTPSLLEPIGGSRVLKAEVVHAVRAEMAQKLADVVYRRTDLGTGELPALSVLRECAQLMADELGWTRERVAAELAHVQAVFPHPVPDLRFAAPAPALAGGEAR